MFELRRDRLFLYEVLGLDIRPKASKTLTKSKTDRKRLAMCNLRQIQVVFLSDIFTVRLAVNQRNKNWKTYNVLI